MNLIRLKSPNPNPNPNPKETKREGRKGQGPTLGLPVAVKTTGVGRCRVGSHRSPERYRRAGRSTEPPST
jgi:hypothetical protein